jgi:hypothetical protein
MNALMQPTTEVAAEQPAQNEPREWFGVIGKDEPRPMMCESREVADATRIFYDSHYPALAPHRVIRMVEQQS